MPDIAIANLNPPVAFCDPHGGGSELKRVASRAAIVVVQSDDIGRIFVMHTWAKRVSTDTLMDEIWRVHERFHVALFGVEANALQTLWVDAIARDAKLRGRRLRLVPVMQPTNRTKANRIRSTLQPLLGAGRIFLQPHMDDLRHEIITHPMNPRTDLVDALASACRLVPPPRARFEEDAERDALLSYLRANGAPLSAIEEATNGRISHPTF